MRKAVITAAVSAVLLLAGCSDDGDQPDASSDSDRTESATSAESTSPPTSTPTSSESTQPSSPTPEPEQADLSVRIDGDRVTPNAQELTVKRGEALTVRIDSDRDGELHVHAKPEQYVEFKAGVTDTELVIEVPGSVEIEDHETGAVVAHVEVR